jgi:hypothetical protein
MVFNLGHSFYPVVGLGRAPSMSRSLSRLMVVWAGSFLLSSTFFFFFFFISFQTHGAIVSFFVFSDTISLCLLSLSDFMRGNLDLDFSLWPIEFCEVLVCFFIVSFYE